MGGEGSLSQAYNHTQCFDISTGKWSQLAPLYTGRHGSGAILHKNSENKIRFKDIEVRELK